MTQKDQAKVIAAGFTIIRKEVIPGANKLGFPSRLRIKVKGSGGHEWKTLEKDFLSLKALEDRMTELLQDNRIIED